MVTAGTAHLLAIITCGARLYQARFSRGPRYRLRGAARLLHVLGAVLSAAALLITVLLFNARLARDQMFVVAGPLAPYEWAGEPWEYPFSPLFLPLAACSRLQAAPP